MRAGSADNYGMTSTPESRRHDKALAHYEPQLQELLRKVHYERMLAELTGQTPTPPAPPSEPSRYRWGAAVIRKVRDEQR